MILLHNNRPLVFTPSFPSDWKVRRLPGAAPQYWSGSEGQVLLQQLHSPRYVIQYYAFRFVEQVTLFCRSRPGLQSLLCLQGRAEHRTAGGEPGFLEKGQFILLHGAGSEASTTVPLQQECHLLNTYYSPGLYRDLEEVFPGLESGQSYRPPRPQYLHTGAMDAMHAQFRQQFRPEIQRAFFELKVKEMLLALLAQNEEPPVQPLDARQQAFVQAAHDCITRDLSRHHTTVDIARSVGVNEADLKRLFRQAYGTGMFELLKHLRFEKAHELLLDEGCTIKQVAAAVGYRHTTTFITEFRRHYGYTPRELQKKR